MSSHDHGGPTGPVADASVRRARPNDAPAVGLVQAAVWREAYAGVVPEEVLSALDPKDFAAAWRRSLEAPPAGAYRLLVSLAGAQVVGFAAVGPTQDPDADHETAELSSLCVHPDARRSGHGSRLLNAAVDTLREAGATHVTCWVLAAADATRGFLAASGFAPDGAHRERVVGPDGETAREVRLGVSVASPDGDRDAG